MWISTINKLWEDLVCKKWSYQNKFDSKIAVMIIQIYHDKVNKKYSYIFHK